MTALLGLFVFIFIAWIFSESKKEVQWIFVIKALVIQIVTAIVFLKSPFFVDVFSKLNVVVITLQEVTDKASTFLFGYLAGGPAPFDAVHAENNFIVAVRVLPLILVISALSALLFHWRILPMMIRFFAYALKRTLGISGPLGLGSAATIFLGTIESPLLIKPYLKQMNRADLFALISCSMATISGTVMVLYASILEKVIPNSMAHLLIASLISVPAALLIARVMIPADVRKNSIDEPITLPSPYANSMDALLKGITEGMNMIVGIIGVILVFFALIYLLNKGLSVLSGEWSLELILGYALRPFMWLTGIPWDETLFAGKLMGTKIVLNEFVSFFELSKMPNALSESSRMILIYGLCGFANIASAGIIIGGLTVTLPERQQEVAVLTFKSLISGNLATLMTAAVAGLMMAR
ncbi:MAG: NupC/NupG family nucleoside CNT transporter [Pseudobdellovibrionaceae bacterium]